MHTQEINLLDYLRIMLRHSRWICGVVALATSIAVVTAFFLPKSYQASTVILPISSKRGGMAMAMTAQLGMLGNLMDTGGASGNQLMTLLKSRTLAERVIERFQLASVLGQTTSGLPAEEMAGRLLQRMAFAEDKKTQTIGVTVIAPSPRLAADIANGYVDELQRFIHDYSFTQAKRYRIYIEGQLAKNKEETLRAGKALNNFYKDGRVSNTESKIDVPIEFSENDLPVVSSLGDVNALREAYTAMESVRTKIDDAGSTTGGLTVVKGVPQQVYFQYMLLRRELLEKMSALLAQQYETAKMEEAKDDLAFQILDPARPPLAKFKPRRTAIVLMTAALAFMVSVTGILLIEQFSALRRPRE